MVSDKVVHVWHASSSGENLEAGAPLTTDRCLLLGKCIDPSMEHRESSPNKPGLVSVLWHCG